MPPKYHLLHTLNHECRGERLNYMGCFIILLPMLHRCCIIMCPDNSICHHLQASIMIPTTQYLSRYFSERVVQSTNGRGHYKTFQLHHSGCICIMLLTECNCERIVKNFDGSKPLIAVHDNTDETLGLIDRAKECR